MKKIIPSIIIFILASNTFAVSVNKSFLQYSLDENKYFIDYINPHITNFSTEEYFKMYSDAVVMNFDASIYFLNGDLKKCFDKILESNGILRKLYYDILVNRYDTDAEQMLKMSGPIILLSKDKKAEYYLREGYVYKAKAENLRKIGFSTNKFMLSQKIKLYINAIDYLIQAKRFAILALVESTIPLIDKSNYKTQTFEEAMKLNEDGSGKKAISDYEHIRNELINNLNKKSLPADFPFLLHHNDNFNVIHENKKSALNQIGETINMSVKGLNKNQKNEEKSDKNPGSDNGAKPESGDNDKKENKEKKDENKPAGK